MGVNSDNLGTSSTVIVNAQSKGFNITPRKFKYTFIVNNSVNLDAPSDDATNPSAVNTTFKAVFEHAQPPKITNEINVQGQQPYTDPGANTFDTNVQNSNAVTNTDGSPSLNAAPPQLSTDGTNNEEPLPTNNTDYGNVHPLQKIEDTIPPEQRGDPKKEGVPSVYNAKKLKQ